MSRRSIDRKVPEGFSFSVAQAGIKHKGRNDIALICSAVESDMAGVFTRNKIKAAPVRLDIKKIKSGRGQAIVVNSGNANACTGKQGMNDALEMVKSVAGNLGIKPSLVYICSTGVIGTLMPMGRIRPEIPFLAKGIGSASLDDVSSAIMTTDTFPKSAIKKIRVEGRTGMIAGICKGAGMICPDMATMLCFIMTDLAVDRYALRRALKDSVDKSFNRITVDGDMSTNDTVLIMANGMIGNAPVTEGSESYRIFKSALDEITSELSSLIVKDGEGATKFIEIEVKGARSSADAKRCAAAIANSNLVKTAIYGGDVNWGRVMAAAGYSGIYIREEKTDIYFGRVKVVSKGISTGKDKDASKILNSRDVRIVLNLNAGKASARVLTCDLTEEYIKVNAHYKT